MIRVTVTLALLVAVLVTAAVAAPAADASARKRICARSATLRDTPRGFAIARLARGQKVVVLRRSAARGWSNVRTASGLPGWVLSRSLCGR